jgi:hypothetical protein
MMFQPSLILECSYQPDDELEVMRYDADHVYLMVTEYHGFTDETHAEVKLTKAQAQQLVDYLRRFIG